RDGRVHPGRDDKVITAWNALAIRALAVAGAVLDEPGYLRAAQRAAEFIRTEMSRADGRLLHAFRAGQAHLDAYVDDYAYTVDALICLFEASGDWRQIQWAVQLADVLLEQFEDSASGGFFYTADDAEALLTRNKDWHDGSLVSGNAATAMVLLKLSRLCQRDDYRAAAERVFQVGRDVMSKQAAACGGLLSALDRYWNDNEQLVVAVTGAEMQREFRPRLLSRYRPNTTLSWIVGEAGDSSQLIPLNQNRGTVDGQGTVYQCRDFVCQTPLSGALAVDWMGSSSEGH
ncbi:MAG: thioredoxin domain-containing protein, partial [Pirellulales bacterium]|nr:thioredoxin domain-containing protein [Pirellulales bacterium]